jgi:DHA2 family multidrug resistance protein
MRGGFSTEADFRTVMVPTVIQGAAVAFFFIPLIALTLTGLRPDQVPAATGLTNFARITAGSFGTSIATTAWFDRASLHHAQLVENVTRYDPQTMQALSGLAARGLRPEQALGVMNRMVDQQAFTLAAIDIFRASALIFLVLVVIVWLARPARGGSASAAAAGAH